MSGRHRLYLNLKQSITKLFKTPAHYLKELTGKQSLFEKPYLGDDYRQMHLNLPVPTWKRPEGEGGGPSLWPKTGSKKFFVIFDEGICGLGTINGGCGEAISVTGSIALVPPGTLNRSYVWSVTSSDPDGARITGIDYSFRGLSVSIRIQLGDAFTGTVTICATAAMAEGYALKELRYDVPPLAIGGIKKKLVEWIPSFEWARQHITPYYEARQIPSWDCGCIDLEITCECVGASWDTAVCAEDATVTPSSSHAVAILDGGSGVKTWSVSGTGFWLDSGYTKTSLETAANAVTVYTDATACGTAVITACGATGYLRSTEGDWVLIDSFDVADCCSSWSGGVCHNEEIVGKLKYYCSFVGTCNNPTGCSCYNVPCLPSGQPTSDCISQDTYEWKC